MAKSKLDLIKEFRLAKAQPVLKGHKLKLYKTLYTVIDTNDKMTLLKDPNGSPIAFQTTKLKRALADDLLKSQKKQAAPAPAAEAPKQDVGKMHAGKIRVDKVDAKGRKYHYWVDSQHGTRHDSHEHREPSDSQIGHDDHKLHTKMLSVINTHAHASDLKKLNGLLNEWVHAKATYHNLKAAHQQMARETKSGFDRSTINKIADKQTEHETKFKQLKEALAASAKRRLK